MKALIMVTAMLFAGTAARAAPIDYPAAPRGDTVDVTGGIKVTDPYRWLEADVRKDATVRAWVEAENKITFSYLATLPKRDEIKTRLTALWDFERFGLPIAESGRVFYRHNKGLQNQATLMVEAPGQAPRVLLDPNTWSKDGATSLADWQPSRDGRHVVYAVQDGGTDWRTLRVMDVDTGAVLPDRLEWVKFSRLTWDHDGRGFFYSRYPATPGGRDFVSAVYDHMIYYHRLGDSQAKDRLIFRTAEHTNYYNDAQTSTDGRWLVIRSSTGSDDRYEITVVDLASGDWKTRKIIAGLTHDYALAGGRGNILYFVTNDDADLYRVVSLDASLSGPARLTTVVPQGRGRIMEAARVGGRLVVASLEDAKGAIIVYPLSGGAGRRLPLPGIGDVALGEDSEDGPLFWSFASFATPSTLYRYDAREDRDALYRDPKTTFRPSDYEVSQVFYASKDGTRVPLFLARKKTVALPAPTMLYGYGGFNISVPPSFSPNTVAWMDLGGVWALANIRGGGEYGTPWHEAGKLFQKQNVFDDFIAAGDYLIRSGVTPKGGLAINGGSNGGLLVGAVTNQRPDLFAAAIPEVGVMDMTRFQLFTEGRTWTDDYGDPADPKALAYNLTYSPYHNIRAGRDYPAILALTADTDDRVVPGHSFKYIAALQAAAIGDKPRLIRIETRAGHGSGKPTDKIIEETADRWAFAGYWTGLTRPAQGPRASQSRK
ncbi:MAG: prolyl oligopeptidase family serine peptidase [Caulobacteraceae bacterium]